MISVIKQLGIGRIGVVQLNNTGNLSTRKASF